MTITTEEWQELKANETYRVIAHLLRKIEILENQMCVLQTQIERLARRIPSSEELTNIAISTMEGGMQYGNNTERDSKS